MAKTLKQVKRQIDSTKAKAVIRRLRQRSLPKELTLDQLLLWIAENLSREAQRLESNSKEGASNTLLQALQLWRKWHPQTTSEFVDLVVSLPNFDPVEFSRELKRRIDETSVSQEETK